MILLELNCEERSGNWPICSWQFALRARRFCWQLRVVRRRSHRTDQLPRAGRRHVNPVFVPTCVFDVIFRWGIRKMCRPARKQLALAVHTSASGRFSPQLLERSSGEKGVSTATAQLRRWPVGQFDPTKPSTERVELRPAQLSSCSSHFRRTKSQP